MCRMVFNLEFEFLDMSHVTVDGLRSCTSSVLREVMQIAMSTYDESIEYAQGNHCDSR